MSVQQKSEGRRQPMEQHRPDSISSSWLLRQIGKKIRHFPRDLSRRLRRSYKKRYGKPTTPSAMQSLAQWVGVGPPFGVSRDFRDTFEEARKTDPGSKLLIDQIGDFRFSNEMDDLVAKALALEPEIGELEGNESCILPYWHDSHYHLFRKASMAIPKGPFDSVVLMPAGRMGGADLVAAILAQALSTRDRVLILRTDDSHWDCPDWFPDTVTSVDISETVNAMQNPRRALYALLSEIDASRIYNVNSRLAFETYVDYGSQLATRYRLYAYYFCADRTPSGVEVGYPVWFFGSVFQHLTAALIDTRDLAVTLRNRYAVPKTEAGKIVTLYTPTRSEIDGPVLAVEQVARAESNSRRPRLLWAGRLDRQKRFDLVVDVARSMPDVDFLCWGKAVLDATPNMSNLPSNLTVHPPFKNYEDLPLTDCDGWFYTSDWDGLPTMLIELGAYGMPIAASAVGGVPELVDESTGWNFSGDANVSDIAATLRDMLANPDARIERATALQSRVRERHRMDDYTSTLLEI